jgi:hypothetical protein
MRLLRIKTKEADGGYGFSYRKVCVEYVDDEVVCVRRSTGERGAAGRTFMVLMDSVSLCCCTEGER